MNKVKQHRRPVAQSQACFVAMLLAQNRNVEITCPVLREWVQLEAAVARAAGSNKVAICPGSKLTRQTCIDNSELLIPLINEVGNSSAFLKLHRALSTLGSLSTMHTSKDSGLGLTSSMIWWRGS